MTSSSPNHDDLFLINRGNTSYKIPYSDVEGSIIGNIPDGKIGATGPAGSAGGLGSTGATGIQGIQGDKGDGFTVVGITTADSDDTTNTYDDKITTSNTTPALSTLTRPDPANPANPQLPGPAVGFCYVNPATQHLWLFDATDTTGDFVSNPESWTTWVDIGQIQGPVGPTGATGATGIQGIEGPQGVTGPEGPLGATGPIFDYIDLTPGQKEELLGATGPQGATGAKGSIDGLDAGIGISADELLIGTVELKPASPIEIGGLKEPTQGPNLIYGRTGDGDWSKVDNSINAIVPLQKSGSNIQLNYDEQYFTIKNNKLSMKADAGGDVPIQQFFPLHLTYTQSSHSSSPQANYQKQQFTITLPRGANYAWVDIFFKSDVAPQSSGTYWTNLTTGITYSGRGVSNLTAMLNPPRSQNNYGANGQANGKGDSYAIYANRSDLIKFSHNSSATMTLQLTCNDLKVRNCKVKPWSGTRVTILPFYSPSAPTYNQHWT